jgi:hypothetical protein
MVEERRASSRSTAVARRSTRRAAGLTAAAGMMLTAPDPALAQDCPVEEAGSRANPDGVEATHSEATHSGTAHSEDADEMAELITQLREDAPVELDPLFDALEDVLL